MSSGIPVVFNIETVFDTGVPEILQPQLNDYEAPSGWKDQEKIDRYKQEKYEEAQKKLSLHPLTGKIICFGARGIGNFDNEQMICSDNELDVLTFAHDVLTEYRVTIDGEFFAWAPAPIVTYNGARFDVPYLISAMMRHNVQIPTILQRTIGKERYWHSTHVDMFKVLGEQGSLAKWALRFGQLPPFGDGSQVQGWWDAEDTTSIKRHCSSGMVVVAELFRRFEGAGLLT